MELYNFKAELIRILDGDTIEVNIDLAFKMFHRRTIRLLGFDAAETRTKDMNEKAKGMEQKFWMQAEMSQHKHLIVQTVKMDNFGRYLGWVFDPEGNNINNKFIDEFPETKI